MTTRLLEETQERIARAAPAERQAKIAACVASTALVPVLTQFIGRPTEHASAAATMTSRNGARFAGMTVIPPGAETDESRRWSLSTRGERFGDRTAHTLSNMWFGRDDGLPCARAIEECDAPLSASHQHGSTICNRLIGFARPGTFDLAAFLDELDNAPDDADVTLTSVPWKSCAICMLRVDISVRGERYALACWPTSINMFCGKHEAETARLAEAIILSTMKHTVSVSPSPQIMELAFVMSFGVPAKYLAQRAAKIHKLARPGSTDEDARRSYPFVVEVRATSVGVVYVRCDGVIYYEGDMLEAVCAVNLFSLGAVNPARVSLIPNTHVPPDCSERHLLWAAACTKLEPPPGFAHEFQGGWHALVDAGWIVWTCRGELFIDTESLESIGHQRLSFVINALRRMKQQSECPVELVVRDGVWAPGPFTCPEELPPSAPPPRARFSRQAGAWASAVMAGHRSK